MSIEQTDLTLGYVALTCSAPLVAAHARGHFEAEGLNVTLSREPSWANIRDKIAVGALDGAHILGPLAIAMSCGLAGPPTPLIAPMALNLNGSAITVSTALAGAMREADPAAMTTRPRSAAALRPIIEMRRRSGQPPLTFAAVFPYSVHNYELRHWLAAGGVYPDIDVRIVVVPPARMVEQLSAGEIDGFCVTAPWNGMAWQAGVGEVLVHASEIWPRSPDKVFGVRADWAETHPQTLAALIRAMARAAAWADAGENRGELAALLAGYIDAPESALRLSLVGPDGEEPAAFRDPDYIIFHREGANRPLLTHERWFISQMARWKQLPPEPEVGPIYRPDLFDAALST
jgi:ABC-type nitrate/sulfonate/bicarbonate transport system substrate-binding protein